MNSISNNFFWYNESDSAHLLNDPTYPSYLQNKVKILKNFRATWITM